jgi:hypothetical protein
MPYVVRDNTIREAGHRQFEKKLVARVWKKWAKPELDISLPAKEAEGPNNGLDGGQRDSQNFGLPLSDRLIFEDERDRDQGHPRFANLAQDGEGSATPGSERGYEDIGIQYDGVHAALLAHLIINAVTPARSR